LAQLTDEKERKALKELMQVEHSAKVLKDIEAKLEGYRGLQRA